MTIKDISAKTGYSVGTVSRVLNNQPNVSEKARKVILEAARKYGFQLNTNAKQLKQQRATSILVVVKGTSNEMFGTLIEAIQAKVANGPYPLIVDYLDEDADEVRRAIQLCLEKKPLGILFLGGNKENFRREFENIGLPCVLVTSDAAELPFENLSSVTIDDRQAGFLAVQHLAQLGHRKIAVIGGDRSVSDTARRRFDGCMTAFAAYDIPFDPATDYRGVRFSYRDGYRAATQLLQSGRDFTALFAMSDVMAIGAIRALRDRGLRVPEDVSVIGLDGLAIGEYTVPRLTTVCQSVEELAKRSVQVLLRQIEDGITPCRETIVPSVACKESTAKL